MQQEELTNTSDGDNSTKGCGDRRKRINRMKIEIIILIIILLLLPTICCIILGLRVSRLQSQVDALLRMNHQTDLSENDIESGHYAYAAEKDELINKDNAAEIAVNPSSDAGQPAETVDAARQSISAEAAAAAKPAIAAGGNPVSAQGIPPDGSNLLPLDRNASAEPADEQSTAKDTVPAGRYSGKKVYLTFDDGPSIYTDDIINILDEYQVKATFFVIGKTDDYSKKIYKKIVEDGHALGMHSFSHQYSRIYNSVEDFDKDFTKLWKLLYDTTGYKPSIFRFPGGSDNLVNKNGMDDFIRYLNKAGIVYFDWNVVNGDATGVTYTKEQLIDNVLNGVEVKTNSIVLMHDAQDKEATVDSLPGLLDVLISEGAQILPLDKEVTPIQMIKAETIK